MRIKVYNLNNLLFTDHCKKEKAKLFASHISKKDAIYKELPAFHNRK